MTDEIGELLLPKGAVLKVLGVGSSTFYTMIKLGALPKGVSIGPRLKRWPASEIQAYVVAQIAIRDSKKKLCGSPGIADEAKAVAPSKSKRVVTAKVDELNSGLLELPSALVGKTQGAV